MHYHFCKKDFQSNINSANNSHNSNSDNKNNILNHTNDNSSNGSKNNILNHNHDKSSNIQDNLSNTYVAIIPADNALKCDIATYYLEIIPSLLCEPHFSKIEFISDYIYGTIDIPEILDMRGSHLSFVCNLSSIIFIDYNGFVKDCYCNVCKLHSNEINSVSDLLYHMINYIISDNLEKINSIQENLATLEQNILNNSMPNPIREITECRNKTMKMYHYYVQLSGICCDLCNKSQNILGASAPSTFQSLSEKITLLVHESQQIWEYTSQIRDVYQQQLEVHQNSIMKFLTIVTTIFMPLTLLTGWYGMNFSHMPELELRYAYPALLGICVLIILILILIFKKKKWW